MTGSQIVFESIGKAALKRFEVPRPGAGEVLLANEYTVVSAGTERANLVSLPNTPRRFPHYPGYSGVGRVIAVGDGVENANIGDRVLSNFSGHRSHAVQRAGSSGGGRPRPCEELEPCCDPCRMKARPQR